MGREESEEHAQVLTVQYNVQDVHTDGVDDLNINISGTNEWPCIVHGSKVMQSLQSKVPGLTTAYCRSEYNLHE